VNHYKSSERTAMKGYIRTGIYVEERVWEEFKQFVKEKYGKLKGTLAKELSEAIKEYLENHRGEIVPVFVPPSKGKRKPRKPSPREIDKMADLLEI